MAYISNVWNSWNIAWFLPLVLFCQNNLFLLAFCAVFKMNIAHVQNASPWLKLKICFKAQDAES